MDFRGADRAQALQVGAILLFGFLIIGLTLYQATVIPGENRGVEFNAYQEAASDMVDLRNDVIAVASRDSAAGTTVKTGVNYPSRAIFVNPGPPANHVRTTGERNVSLENVAANDSEAANTQQFVEGELNGTLYTTRDIEFQPGYSVFGGQPMVVTGQQAYRHADGTLIPMSGQSLLQGDRLTLTFVDGDLAGSGDLTSITTDPVSASRRTVTIEGENDSQPLVVRMQSPPGVTAQEWVDKVGAPLNASNDRVENVSTDGETIVLELDPNRTYQLRMAKVETRERGDSSTVGETGPSYIVDVEGNGTIAPTNATRKLTVELRDKYNNPVSGEVKFTTNDGTLTRTTVITGEDGRASVGFTPDEPGDVEVTANATDVDDPNYGTVTFQLYAERGSQDTRGGSNTGDQINPSRENSIILGSATVVDNGDAVELDLENLDSNAQNITAMRYNFYYVNRFSQGSTRDPPPRMVYVDEDSEDEHSMQIRGAYNENVRIEFEGGEPETITLNFEDGDSVEEGDFFVISVIIDDGRDTATYFISPRE